jgi:predicted nucleotidyltransferase
MIENLKKNNTFIDCDGKMICSLIGGSYLYGLNNAQSDIDYRGIFVANNKKYLAGFENVDSIVTDNEIDSTYYEIGRFLKLMRKSNTQVMEILFAPDSAFEYKHPIFDRVRDNKYKLINSETLKNSLRGYIYAEMKLATGERTGQLGGKRKAALDKYKFSPKNFVQLLRLCRVGQIFFETGEYMVKVLDFDEKFHQVLMDIKNTPENYNLELLKAMVELEYEALNKIMDESMIRYVFDIDLASDIILEARKL